MKSNGRKITCRLSLNFSDFEEKRYLFVPYTFDLEQCKFIDHWERAVEAHTVPDHMRCLGFVGDDMYADKAAELIEAAEFPIGVIVSQGIAGTQVGQ